MSSDDDHIIQQQADRIEELESEVVQLYDELYHKKKHKEKHELAEPEKVSPHDEEVNSPLLHPVRLVWWHLVEPEEVKLYYKSRIRLQILQDKWKVTAFLNYFPLLIATVGYMLGASVAPLSVPVRFAIGVCFLPLLFIAWLMTAGLEDPEDKRRAYSVAFIVGLTFALLTFLPQLREKSEWVSGWGQGAVITLILFGAANAGLTEGIAYSLSNPERKENPFQYARTIHLTYTIILLGFACMMAARSFGAYGENLSGSFLLLLFFLSPLLSPAAYVMVLAVASIFILSETIQASQIGKALPKVIRGRFKRFVKLAFLWVFYVGFVLTTLIAIFD